MYGKSNMETCIIICKIDGQQEFALWLRKLKQGLCINLEGWDGEGDGREVRKGGDICKIAVKRRSEKQRRKGKIYLFECRVPKNSKER